MVDITEEHYRNQQGTFVDEDEYLEHIGIARRSGRYPWGSGKNPQQRSRDFMGYVEEMRGKGLTDPQIADTIDAYVKEHGGRGFKTPDLRAGISISTENIFAENSARAIQMKAKQMSNGAIAEAMGLPRSAESTVRGWLKASDEVREGSNRAVANKLKDEVETKEFLDVGKGSNLYMGVSETKLKTAVAMLRDEGYEQFPISVPQLTTGENTRYKVLTKPGVTYQEAALAVREGRLQNVTSHSDDGGMTMRTPAAKPVSISSSRLQVRHGDEGGKEMDGVIELRRGVEDLSLGASRYAQVRVAVDKTHYLKGMAMYADDLPDGVDVRFNTNKSRADVAGKGKLAALKAMKEKNGEIDTDNPFGASTYPRVYLDKNGKEKTSPLNIVGSRGVGNEEGRWSEWSKSLSSQMLSKQSVTLAANQLGLARKAREKELKEILSLTNPVVKEKLLREYSDSADAAAVHLKAAHLPDQSTHVILPMNTVRTTEIYAPKYDDGTKVVLVRHPHGGPFEIPELTVNNKNAQAKRILGNAKDAVGIHHSVAEQLSGADFDGDTVLVIPNNNRAVKTRPYLESLKNFDPKVEYVEQPGMVKMTKKNTQTEMGRISNLITDMTVKKASEQELARAVRHSMVVIDAEKHSLNYKQSEKDHNITQLKRDYQGGPNNGASTLISKASSTARIPEVKLRSAQDGGPIDPKTGEFVYVPTGVQYPKTTTRTSKRTGEVTEKTTIENRTTKGTQMEFAKDARSLSSGTPIEEVYASHANSMKALANQARKEMVAITMPKQNKQARAIYDDEVKSIDAKLKIALRNAPLERQAQVVGNAIARARIDADPSLDKADVKKIKAQSLEEARLATGASKKRIGSVDSPLTDREWEAIQAHAVSPSKLREVLANADMDRIRELATPRATSSLSPGQIAKAQQMYSMGKTQAEIAATLGIPRSTISDNLAR